MMVGHTHRMRLWAVATLLGVVMAGSPKPHLVFLLADDQGWSNIGLNRPELIGDEVRKVVSEGVKLTNHRVFKFCSPTRSSFLSGRWPIHVNQENSATRQRYAGSYSIALNPTHLVHANENNGIPLNMTTISEKLSAAGYICHHFGKWHVGQATMAHIPVGRGFTSSLTYFNFGEDHFTQIRGGQAMFEEEIPAPSNCEGVDLWNTNKPAYGQNGTYGGYSFTKSAVAAIEAHDATKPLFLFVAFQNLHPPLQVPHEFVQKYPTELQTTINGMTTFLDESVGNVTRALKSTGLWDNTLVVYSSDNGGYLGNGGNSTPYRGGKFSDFDGGTRVPAWFAGGIVAPAMRGTELNTLVHIADWYATFCALGGCDSVDLRAKAAGLPPIDSQDLSGLITGANTTTPHAEMVLSALAPQGTSGPVTYFGSGEGIISGKWKLVTGVQLPGPFGSQTGHPQCGSASAFPSTAWGPSNPGVDCDCGAGCLFDIENDSIEAHNIASANPAVVARLQARLDVYRKGVYAPYRGDIEAAACEQVVTNGGYWGPWLPSPSPWPPVV